MHGRRITGFSPSLVFVLFVGLAAAVATQARAEEPSKAVKRARSFLDSASVGRDVLSVVHFGAHYDGHDCTGVRRIRRDGEVLSGHFALVYDYKWEGDGKTTLAFLCNASGNVYKVQVLKSNAVINAPFALSKVSISVVGGVLLEAFKDKMSSTERAQLETIISNADPKELLEFAIQVRQAIEG